MFALRQLMEKRLEVQGEMTLGFVDLEKTYDTVPREMVKATLRWMEVPEADVSFGNKEDYMVFLSGFVEVQSTRMHRFLAEVSRASNTPAGPATPEGFVDLGRELSCLHSLLAETLLPDQQDNMVLSNMEELEPLPRILSELNETLQTPTPGEQPQKRRSLRCGLRANGLQRSLEEKLNLPRAESVTRLPTPTHSNEEMFFLKKGSPGAPMHSLSHTETEMVTAPEEEKAWGTRSSGSMLDLPGMQRRSSHTNLLEVHSGSQFSLGAQSNAKRARISQASSPIGRQELSTGLAVSSSNHGSPRPPHPGFPSPVPSHSPMYSYFRGWQADLQDNSSPPSQIIFNQKP
uniref:disabled homolog 2-interacting protein-like n=1 Tax=Myxine glutinosa TaxID=7769 RepID=UPI00358FD2DE